MTEAQVTRLVAHLQETVGIDLPEWPGGWPNEVESALLDAIFSIRARYGGPTSGVRAVVHRWRDHRRGSADDLSALTDIDGAVLAEIVSNRSKASGRLKAEVVTDAAAALLQSGLRHSGDFTGAAEQKSAYLSVRGCGPVTWSYFGMLMGRPDVKADTWVTRFVRQGLADSTLSAEATRQLVIAAANEYRVSASRLDHAIWLTARGSLRKGR